VSASRLVNRNVVAASGRTSMRLEPELWDALLEICHRENQDIHGVIRHIDGLRSEGGRTSAVRVFLLKYFRAAGTEEGHITAGHGQYVEQRGAARSSIARFPHAGRLDQAESPPLSN
jgi:predicted DNA-binding ribbon-helix-helix protein